MWILTKLYYRIYQLVMSVGMKFVPLIAPAPKIIEGADSIKELPAVIKKKRFKSVLIVTDQDLMGLHLLDTLFEALKTAGIAYGLYDQVQPNPTIDNIEEALKVYHANNCQAIIAFGGGSPIDCAKATGARVSRPDRSVVKLMGLFMVMLPSLKMKSLRPPFLIAVPTTAGTGSEATIASVVSNPQTHEKKPIYDPLVKPRIAVFDPVLTVGLPPHITSTTGMDALAHAVESYCNKFYNNRKTLMEAVMATAMIFKYLERAYADGSDLEARGQMLLAAHYAGDSFSRGAVGYVHGIGHNLGALYGVPHGLAMSVVLPYGLESYGQAVHRPLSELAEVIGVTRSGMNRAQMAEAFIQAVRDLNRHMNIPEKFDCIEEEDIPVIAERALKEVNPLYPVPRIMNKKEVMAVIHQLKAPGVKRVQAQKGVGHPSLIGEKA